MNAPAPYQSPAAAQSGLTSAFNPTNDAETKAIANAASLVPTNPQASPIPSTPTVLSSKDMSGSFTSNSDALAAKTTPLPGTGTVPTNPGTTTTPTTTTPTPSTTTPSTNTTSTPAAGTDGAPTVTTGDPIFDSLQSWEQQQQSQAAQDAADKKQQISQMLTTNLANNNASYGAQINSITNTYQRLIDTQTRINTQNIARTKAYGLSSGNAMSTPLEYTGAVSDSEQTALTAIQKLDTERDGLISQAQTAEASGNAKLLQDSMDAIDKVESDMQATTASLGQQVNERYTALQAVEKNQQTQLQQQAQSYLAAASLKYVDGFATGDNTQKDAIVKQIVNESGGLVTYGTALSSLQGAQTTSVKSDQSDTNLAKSQALTVTDERKAAAGAPGAGSVSEIDPASATALKNALSASKFQGSEADGKYADPNLYLANYNSWTAHGGDAATFLKEFPPATYINPANKFLPADIMKFVPQPKASSATDINAAIDAAFK